MKFEKINFKIKTGELITIRIPEETDAQNVLNLKREYISNTTTLPFTLDEYPDNLINEKKLIEDYENSLNSIFLLAEFNGELIGNIDLTGSKRSKMSHTAMLGMGIKASWRNKGLGKVLIESILKWAKEDSEIRIVWLDVYASNKLGYNLYKNTGFEISGIIKNFFKEGQDYIDKIQMYQQVK